MSGISQRLELQQRQEKRMKAKGTLHNFQKAKDFNTIVPKNCY